MNIIAMESRMKNKSIDSDISLAKRGDKEAYVRLMRENKASMYRVAKSILIIEDAVSEAVLKGYTGINKLRKDDYFKTWIIRILINECNLIYKKRKKEVFLEKAHIETLTEEENKKDFDLYEAVNLLDEDLRITTLLFYFEDMKYKDIAEILKIREGTVKSRLSRAKEKLYKLLEEVK